ncbi:MAG: hypothetical protein K2X53_06275 [Alphaproteobacteria bacterium]|nr:hypothetical protein [Alphaproteobacteria bacterium]
MFKKFLYCSVSLSLLTSLLSNIEATKGKAEDFPLDRQPQLRQPGMMPSLKRKRDDICELPPAKRLKLEDPLIVFDSFQDMASHIPFPHSSQKEGAVDIFSVNEHKSPLKRGIFLYF